MYVGIQTLEIIKSNITYKIDVQCMRKYFGLYNDQSENYKSNYILQADCNKNVMFIHVKFAKNSTHTITIMTGFSIQSDLINNIVWITQTSLYRLWSMGQIAHLSGLAAIATQEAIRANCLETALARMSVVDINADAY